MSRKSKYTELLASEIGNVETSSMGMKKDRVTAVSKNLTKLNTNFYPFWHVSEISPRVFESSLLSASLSVYETTHHSAGLLLKPVSIKSCSFFSNSEFRNVIIVVVCFVVLEPTTTAPCHTAIKSTTTTESSKPSPAGTIMMTAVYTCSK